MAGVKRKHSRSAVSERPAKLAKRSTSSTVFPTRLDTIPRPPLAPIKLTGKKKSVVKTDVPGLRRAETLPIEETAVEEAGPVVEPVTTVRKLPSGTSVGITTREGSVTKLTTKKSSLIRHDSLSKSLSTGSKAGSLSKVASLSRKASSVRAGTSSADVIAPPLPPGGLMEIVFSFDTTGSMSSCLDQVRGRVSDMIQRLQADIPGIRVAVFAHGDYCDAKLGYVTKWIDFGSTLPELCDFVQNVEGTGGGDFEECYELVLRQAQEELTWTPGSQRSLVMIGDATPHLPNYPQNKLKISWQQECKKLNKMGVRIYAVQAKDNSTSTKFYADMAELTGGRHLKLDEFSNIFDMMMAICYREGGTDLFRNYEEEVRARHGGAALHKDLELVFSDLRGDDDDDDDDHVPRPSVTKKAPAKRAVANVGTAKKTTKPKVAAKKSPAKPSAIRPKGNAKPKTSKKSKVTTKKRKFRELATDKEFRENTKKIDWSLWKAGLKMTCDPAEKKEWNQRGGLKKGHIRRGLFQKMEGKLALFEIGVQAKKRGRIFSVYLAQVDKFKPGKVWHKQILHTKSLIQQVDAVISSKTSRILVRTGIFNAAKTRKGIANGTAMVRDQIFNLYDYAWTRARHSKKPRTAKRNGVYISKKYPNLKFIGDKK